MLSEILSLTDNKQKKKLYLVNILIILTAIFEILSVILVSPFIGLLLDFNIIYENDIIKYFYNFFEFNSAKNFLIFVSVVFLFVTILSSFIHAFTIWMVTKTTIQLGADLSTQLYNFYLDQKWLFHTENNSSKLIAKISQEVERVILGFITPCFYILSKLIIVLSIVSLLLFYNLKVTFILVSCLLIFYLIFFLGFKKILLKNGNLISNSQLARIKLMQEGFGGIRDIIISQKKSNFKENFLKSSHSWAKATSTNIALPQTIRFLIELLVITLVVGYIIFNSTEDNFLTIKKILPILGIYLMSAVKIIPALQIIFGQQTSIKGTRNAY